jgi:folate-binding protein YgfZ
MASEIAHLASRAPISVSGPDWRSFLEGLITQDVETLQPGEMRYGALLAPQGRLLHDLFITGGDEGATLDVSAAARDALIAKLTLYRLRAKVQIAPLDAQVFAAWGKEPAVNGVWFSDPRLPALGFRSYSENLSYPDALSEDAYDAHRLALGVSDPEKDAVENDFPIEANFDLLNGIDFKKGCFVGQETTSRMHRRGMVKTRMAPIRFEGPALPFGAAVMAGDRRAGEVRSGLDGLAMASLRLDRAASAPLTVDGRPVTLDPPPWIARLFQECADETPQSEAKLG